VGLERADDAGVYRISDDIALIQTVDFFTPIVDDPYCFGQIAAVNALSDVYAMGGVPKTAMNIIGFPISEMDISVLRRILQGGLDKMREADVVIVGGHSVEDSELKYGLSVTGFVHPDHILTKKNIKAEDILILTKPLGTGIINTAIKGGIASDLTVSTVTQLMATLNRGAAETMLDYPVHACTDITGFGFLGHIAEMIIDTDLGVEIQASKVPFLEEALTFAGMGFVPAGAYKNREFVESMVEISPELNPILLDVLFDPQTSGGLLICVDKKSASYLTNSLNERGLTWAAPVGKVISKPKEKIVLI
jgi:selenide,water dikinase